MTDDPNDSYHLGSVTGNAGQYRPGSYAWQGAQATDTRNATQDDYAPKFYSGEDARKFALGRIIGILVFPFIVVIFLSFAAILYKPEIFIENMKETFESVYSLLPASFRLSISTGCKLFDNYKSYKAKTFNTGAEIVSTYDRSIKFKMRYGQEYEVIGFCTLNNVLLYGENLTSASNLIWFPGVKVPEGSHVHDASEAVPVPEVGPRPSSPNELWSWCKDVADIRFPGLSGLTPAAGHFLTQCSGQSLPDVSRKPARH